MSSTHTSTLIYTTTHTATHLTRVVLGAVTDILSHLGIDGSRMFDNWGTYEGAIQAWIEEGSLAVVALECTQPSGEVSPIFEFPVEYTTTRGAEFRASEARLARYRQKLDAVPQGTTFRLVCAFNGPHSLQLGWSRTTRASTATLTSLSFGTLGRAPDASLSMRYHR